jgi:hypothetical protein
VIRREFRRGTTGARRATASRETRMQTDATLLSIRRVGTGVAFVVFPLVFVFAFAVHPGLFRPHFLGPLELIRRAHHARILHLAHALVTLDTALLVVVALHLMRVLEQRSAAWAGFVGGALSVLGSLALAADKGALCLTTSSLEGLSDAEFSAMMPGLLAMFGKGGWLWMLWGILLLPIGFGIQALGLLRTRAIGRGRALLFLVGVLLIGMPDGAEIVNLTAAVLLSIAFVPYGLSLMRVDRGEPSRSALILRK